MTNEEKIEILLGALVYVRDHIDESEHWWMNSPDRGGFDMDIIEGAIDIVKAAE